MHFALSFPCLKLFQTVWFFVLLYYPLGTSMASADLLTVCLTHDVILHVVKISDVTMCEILANEFNNLLITFRV